MLKISIPFLCMMFSSTLGSTLMQSTQLSIEDTIISLEKKVEEMLTKYQNDMKKLTEKMEEVETTSKTRDNELYTKFQEFEEKTLEEKISEKLSKMEMVSPKTFDELSDKLQKDVTQLTEKVKEVETTSKTRESELYTKFQEFEEKTLEEKVSEKLSKVEMVSPKTFDELSDKLQKDVNQLTGKMEEVKKVSRDHEKYLHDLSNKLQENKNSILKMDNYFLKEIAQMQKKGYESMEKINNVINVLDGERSKIETLQVKMNKTQKVLDSHFASQIDAHDSLRQNISLASENSRLYVDESLKLGFERMQSNLTSKMRSLEASLLEFEKYSAKTSYVSQLDERLQNLNETVKDVLQPILAELSERVKILEEMNSNNISTNITEDECSPPCENGGTCEAGNTCICGGLFSGERCQDAVCSPPCQNGGTCLAGNECRCDFPFRGLRCEEGDCPPEDPFSWVANLTPSKAREQLKVLVCEKYDYVWKGRLNGRLLKFDGFLNISFFVEEVIKAGIEKVTDVEGETRTLLAHDNCQTAHLLTGAKYLILGGDGLAKKNEKGESWYQYFLEETSVVYLWTSSRNSKDPQLTRNLYYVTRIVKVSGCV